MIKQKKGGAMPGAGRKPVQREKCKVYTFCIRPAHEPQVRGFIKKLKQEHSYERHTEKK